MMIKKKKRNQLINMKKYILYTVFFAAFYNLSFAQFFTHLSKIDKVKKDGLCKILLGPEVKQYMSKDFHDLRIHDSLNHEVPYVLLSEPLLKSKSDFIPYEIISQTHFSSYSEIIIHNARQDKISNIAFNINNSDAFKYCTIEGSEDGKQWYSVSALQELTLLYNDDYTNQYKCIYFPLNNYTYFRLLVDDWFSQPLKINSAGYFKNSVIAGKLCDVNFSKQITEDLKRKKTVIALRFNNNQAINRLDFKISEPRLFMRHARVFAKRESKIKDRIEHYEETLGEFDLKSDKPLFIDIPEMNEKEVFIEIDNKDNPPLKIDTLLCKQLASYLICDLKANRPYYLKCGNTKLNVPEYDLINFVSQIPQLLPEIKLGDMESIKQVSTQSIQTEKAFYETKWFLWLCLGFTALIIFFFSKSLLTDIGKNKEQ